METKEQPDFWEWLKEKAKQESFKKPFEPIPLYISVYTPKKKDREHDDGDTLIDYEIDYEVDNVVFEL